MDYGPDNFWVPNRYKRSFVQVQRADWPWMSAFMGVTQPEVITTRGIAMGPEHRSDALRPALDKVASLETA